MCLCAGAAVGPPAGDRPFSWLCSGFVSRNGGVAPASPELSFLRLLPEVAECVHMNKTGVDTRKGNASLDAVNSCHSKYVFLAFFLVDFFVFRIFVVMKNILKYPSRCFRWFRRFRNRCGYGIHSPFAFQLVTGCIYESGEYYEFARLADFGKQGNSCLRAKDHRLLFRLVNQHAPAAGLILGCPDAVVVEYLKTARRTCIWQEIPDLARSFFECVESASRSVDFVYIHAGVDLEKAFRLLLPYLNGRSLVVVCGIHGTRKCWRDWKRFIAAEKVRVSFDLYDFGLAYFEERLNKENYVINYF